jgi:O-succinylbenzoate synthase
MTTLGADLEVHVVSIPMRVPFRGVTDREAALFHGPAGWGEFSPFLEYGDVEASRWLASAIESAAVGWPAPLRSTVPVNATVPAVAAREVADVLARFPGCMTAKVKVGEAGQALSDDVDRVSAVRDVLGPEGRIRVDANGAWTVDEAVDAIAALKRFDLEYVEQPCAAVEDLAAVRRRVDVLIAADESVRKAADPMRVVKLEAADVLVLKVAPLGGVAPALEIAQLCGLPVVVSSALDTSVGIAAGVALAAALPQLPYACGLATLSLMHGDVAEHSLEVADGVLEVRRAEPHPALLGAFSASRDRQVWWSERIARCVQVLA